MSVLGMMIDNHDKVRFLNYFKQEKEDPLSLSSLLNALTFAYMSKGIPMVYYGTEYLLAGGEDPFNREVFNPSDFKNKKNIIKYIKKLNEVRKDHRTYEQTRDPVWRHIQEDFMTFSKGDNIFVILTNTGS